MNIFSKIAAVSSTLKGVLVLVVLAAIGVGGYFAYTGIMGIAGKVKEVAEDTGGFLAGRPTQHGAALGEKCNVGADCKGFVSAFNQQGGIACCQNKCGNTAKDYANVWWCPHECKGSPTDPPGSCGKYHWPRIAGEPCNLHTDCEGWGPDATANACCQGKCSQKKKDYVGAGWCPHECKSGLFAAAGTC
jgi:hypothetical protein